VRIGEVTMSNGLLILARMLIFPGAIYLVAASLLIDWIDRWLVARWQGRVGPPWYQPLADLIKLLSKEDILVRGGSPVLGALLPMVAAAATMTASLYIPSGWGAVGSFERDLGVVLFLFGVPSLAYFLAGWVAPSVYGVIGGNRALLQYFSYEVPLLMALVAPAIYTRSWSIVTLMEAQGSTRWHVFLMPVGFVVAITGLIGKLNRVPFDIPHAKAEIGAGALTEYSGRTLALWKLAVALQTLVGLTLLVAVYLGGGSGVPAHFEWPVFALKLLFLVALLSLVQVLCARLRIDQMAEMGWRYLVPLGVLQMLAVIWMGRG
jgi:NADH-quinone oxidoreductase subunit H